MLSLDEIREDQYEALEIGGIVINHFQRRAKFPAEIVEELRQQGLPILEPYISSSVKIREGHQRLIPLVCMEPKHREAGELTALYQALA